MRLALSVVFSSLAGYLLGAETVDLKTLVLLAFGGYFMVGASNAFNQIIEKLVKEIPLQNRVSLTHYVARRKLTLKLFGKILERKLDIQDESHRDDDEKLLPGLDRRECRHRCTRSCCRRLLALCQWSP